MSNVHVPVQKAIALQPGDGEALWFMGFLATIKAAGEEQLVVSRLSITSALKTPDHRFMCTTARTNGSTSWTAS